MAKFDVVIMTAPPAGQSEEAGGAMVRIDGKESLLRAVELFMNREEIVQVIVVFDADEMPAAKKRFGSHFAFTGVKLAAGGPRWLDQAAAAAPLLSAEATHVILHDGARCCVPYTDIDCLLEETAKAAKAVGMVSPLRSTVLEVDDHGKPVAYHLPNRYVQLLMPQGFTRATFEAMAESKQEVHAAEIDVVKGSPLNVRVAGQGDEQLAKTMLGMLPKPVKRGDGPFGEAQW